MMSLFLYMEIIIYFFVFNLCIKGILSMLFIVFLPIKILILYVYYGQRWSRGHKAQGQGSPSEDRPSRGQEQQCSRPRTQAQVFSTKKFFSSDLQKNGLQKKCLLVLELRSRSFYVLAYANDLAVLVAGADMLWIRGTAEKAINVAANWALEQELQFSSKKTEIVLFTENGIQIWVPCQ